MSERSEGLIVGVTRGLAANSTAEHRRAEQLYVLLQDDATHPVEIQAWVGYSVMSTVRLTRKQAKELAALLHRAAVVDEREQVAAHKNEDVMTSDGRTVHASCDSLAVDLVRYDRAGKWYIEPRDKSLPRQQVCIVDAVRTAMYWWTIGGTPHFDRPGGVAFNRAIRKLNAGSGGSS